MITNQNKPTESRRRQAASSKMTQSGVPPVICEICSQTFDKEDLKIKAPTHFLGKKHQKSMFRSNYIKPAIFLPGIKIKIHKCFFLKNVDSTFDLQM